jgi:hypothetical protein
VTAVGADLPPLSAEVVGDDDQLGEAVDDLIRRDRVASERTKDIIMLTEVVRDAVDPEGWRLVLEWESRSNERWADLAVVLARWAFNEGVRSASLRRGGA